LIIIYIAYAMLLQALKNRFTFNELSCGAPGLLTP